uniref:Uncharacterized protein n=1 Tax=Eutreptiella gymnastica TaxID=73025 RepID=A0A7S1IBZ1_9EUGL
MFSAGMEVDPLQPAAPHAALRRTWLKPHWGLLCQHQAACTSRFEVYRAVSGACQHPTSWAMDVDRCPWAPSPGCSVMEHLGPSSHSSPAQTHRPCRLKLVLEADRRGYHRLGPL